MQGEVNFSLPHRVSSGAKKKHPHRYFVVCVLSHRFAFIFRASRGPGKSLERLFLLNLNPLPAVSIFFGEFMDPRPFFVTGDSAREYVAQAPQAFGS